MDNYISPETTGTKKKLIDFTEIILRKVEDTRIREGHRTFTSTLFSIVTQYYDKKYYDKRAPMNKGSGIVSNDEMTPEQICEALGGKVSRNESGPVCLIPKGHNVVSVPMTMMGEKGMLGDYRIK